MVISLLAPASLVSCWPLLSRAETHFYSESKKKEIDLGSQIFLLGALLISLSYELLHPLPKPSHLQGTSLQSWALAPSAMAFCFPLAATALASELSVDGRVHH